MSPLCGGFHSRFIALVVAIVSFNSVIFIVDYFQNLMLKMFQFEMFQYHLLELILYFLNVLQFKPHILHQ
jgi:hypothetical protein